MPDQFAFALATPTQNAAPCAFSPVRRISRCGCGEGDRRGAGEQPGRVEIGPMRPTWQGSAIFPTPELVQAGMDAWSSKGSAPSTLDEGARALPSAMPHDGGFVRSACRSAPKGVSLLCASTEPWRDQVSVNTARWRPTASGFAADPGRKECRDSPRATPGPPGPTPPPRRRRRCPGPPRPA